MQQRTGKFAAFQCWIAFVFTHVFSEASLSLTERGREIKRGEGKGQDKKKRIKEKDPNAQHIPCSLHGRMHLPLRLTMKYRICQDRGLESKRKKDYLI